MNEKMKVIVYDGTGKTLLGEGTLVGHVTVFVVRLKDGTLQSLTNAEERPDEIPEGATLEVLHDNPKIVMDDGSVRYGCQVWWYPAEAREATGLRISTTLNPDGTVDILYPDGSVCAIVMSQVSPSFHPNIFKNAEYVAYIFKNAMNEIDQFIKEREELVR